MLKSLLATIVVALVITGCTFPETPGPKGPTPTQTFGSCSSDAVRVSAEGIMGNVTSALATGSYETAIVSLLSTYTAAEVGCAVDLVISEFTKKAARTDDTETQVVLVHAKAWRAAHPAS